MLSIELLSRIRERAAGYDERNEFFWHDLDDLRDVGYLAPRPLLDTVRSQRRLAAFAPATALGINMHHVVVGIARVLADRGDDSLRWMLDEAEHGELFAFGNSEAGNDSVMFDSTTVAERHPDGSVTYSGRKIFTSLSPAWTRLVVFGRDGDDLVHGVLTRDAAGWRALDDWNTLGMRATQSQTTVLEGARVDAERVVRVLPVGPSADPYMFALFANFLLLISSVYAGIADRALELAVEAAHARTSRKHDGRPLASDPDYRWRIADAAIALDALRPQLESLASDVDSRVDHGAEWFRLLVGVKHRAVETAREVVDQAVRVAGGSAYRSAHELSRLQRDVLAGIHHPSSTESVHATVASNLLGPLD